MQQFTPRPNSFGEIRKKIVIIMLIIFIGLVFTVLVVPQFFSGTNSTDGPTTWPYVIILLAAVMGFSIFNALKRQQANFESFKLKITDEAIVREAIHVPVITIPKTAVREIIKNANGSFTIIGDSRLNAIGVPAQISDPELLERLLNEIKPAQVRTARSWLERLFIPISFSGVALMMTTFIASNKIIVLTSGLACVAILTYSLIVIQRSKNVDTRTKRGSLVVILPLLAVIAVIVMKLMS
jgi:hypothetical protein